MILSEVFKEQLTVSLMQQPLSEKEVRRLEGLGELYISLIAEENMQSGEYEFLYSYRIDDALYNFYSRLDLKDLPYT